MNLSRRTRALRRRSEYLVELSGASKRRYKRLTEVLAYEPEYEERKNYTRLCVRAEDQQLRAKSTWNRLGVTLSMLFVLLLLLYFAFTITDYSKTSRIVGGLVGLIIVLALPLVILSATTNLTMVMLLPLAGFLALAGTLPMVAAAAHNSSIFPISPSFASDFAIGFLETPIAIVLIFEFIITASLLILRYQRRMLLRTLPELHAFQSLQLLLEWLAGSPRRFQSLSSRQRAIRDLERVARSFEVGFARCFERPSAVEPIFLEVGAFFRGLERWVAFPDEGTQARLHRVLSSAMQTMASASYHYLPRAPVVELEPPRPLLVRLRQGSKTFLVGAAPIATFLVAEGFHLSVDPQLRTTWFIGGLIWAFVTLITATDPLSAAKLETANDLLDLFGKKRA